MKFRIMLMALLVANLRQVVAMEQPQTLEEEEETPYYPNTEQVEQKIEEEEEYRFDTQEELNNKRDELEKIKDQIKLLLIKQHAIEKDIEQLIGQNSIQNPVLNNPSQSFFDTFFNSSNATRPFDNQFFNRAFPLSLESSSAQGLPFGQSATVSAPLFGASIGNSGGAAIFGSSISTGGGFSSVPQQSNVPRRMTRTRRRNR